MTVCSVQRCDQETAGRFTTHEKVFMETAVCGDHLQRLEAGEPWAYQGVDRTLLMTGNGLPPVVTKYELHETVGPGVTLLLGGEGDAEMHSFWLSNESAERLGRVLSGNL